MSQEYQVTEVSPPREWSGNYGPMVSYDLALAGVDERVELAQKPTTPPPTVSQILYGHVEPSPHGPRFKKDQRPDAQPHSNGGGQRQQKQDKPWSRQPTPPEDAARMRRCHSQEMAVRAVEMAVGLNVGDERPESMEALLNLVRRTADWFDQDVERTVTNELLSSGQTLDDAARRSEQAW